MVALDSENILSATLLPVSIIFLALVVILLYMIKFLTSKRYL